MGLVPPVTGKVEWHQYQGYRLIGDSPGLRRVEAFLRAHEQPPPKVSDAPEYGNCSKGTEPDCLASTQNLGLAEARSFAESA